METSLLDLATRCRFRARILSLNDDYLTAASMMERAALLYRAAGDAGLAEICKADEAECMAEAREPRHVPNLAEAA